MLHAAHIVAKVSKAVAHITDAKDLEDAILYSEPPVSLRVNPNKITQSLPLEQVRWADHGYYLPKRPVFTLDPLFHAGAYYVQEASSMFIESILKPIAEKKTLKVLDLCAAPGGKSSHIISLLQRGSLLVANEFVRSRAYILSENLIKWGKSNCVVTNNSARDFKFLHGFFDVVLVDAPCSGEGMFRKNPDSILEWSPANVEMCAERQLSILQDIWECVAPQGHLIYSTCTYNELENEDVVHTFLKQVQGACKEVPLPHNSGIIAHTKGNAISYRFFPHLLKGEGFAATVIQKHEGESYMPPKRLAAPKKIHIITEKNKLQYSKLIVNHESVVYEDAKQVVWSFSKDYRKFLIDIFAHCSILHAGIPLVQIQGHKLNPMVGLAYANSFNPHTLIKHQIDLETALRYFKREALQLDSSLPKGWIQLVYKGVSIGFVKNIGNRANNSYPKEWSIKMNLEQESMWSLV